MPEILLQEDEPIDSGLKRFKRAVAKSGILGDSKSHSFFISRGEKKRLKSRKARQRLRRLAKRFPAPVIPDWEEQKPWSCDTEWPIDLATEGRRPESGFACGIIERTVGNSTGILVVMNEPDPVRGPGQDSDKYSFPGGGLDPDKDKTLEDAAVREVWEETGIKVLTPHKNGIVFSKDMPNNNGTGIHKFVCYKLKVRGGEPKKGEEIKEMRLIEIGALKKLADTGHLRYNHKLAFIGYLEKYHPELLREEAQACTA